MAKIGKCNSAEGSKSGKWFEFRDADGEVFEVLIYGSENPKVKKTAQRLQGVIQRKGSDDQLEKATNDLVMAVIGDWKELYNNDGSEYECTEDNKQQLIDMADWLKRDILKIAQEPRYFLDSNGKD